MRTEIMDAVFFVESKERPINTQMTKSAKGSVSGDLKEKSIFLKQIKIRTIKNDE